MPRKGKGPEARSPFYLVNDEAGVPTISATALDTKLSTIDCTKIRFTFANDCVRIWRDSLDIRYEAAGAKLGTARPRQGAT